MTHSTTMFMPIYLEKSFQHVKMIIMNRIFWIKHKFADHRHWPKLNFQQAPTVKFQYLCSCQSA